MGTEEEQSDDAMANEELVTELITALVRAMDQRHEQHQRATVLPLAQRIETLSQGFAQLFALVKHNRRDMAALEAMKTLLADASFAERKTTPEIAELAYNIAEAMEERAQQAEKSAAEAIREATEALQRAREEGKAQKLEAPGDLARRLVSNRKN